MKGQEETELENNIKEGLAEKPSLNNLIKIFIILFLKDMVVVIVLPIILLYSDTSDLNPYIFYFLAFLSVLATPVIVYHLSTDKKYKNLIGELISIILSEAVILIIILWVLLFAFYHPVGGDASLYYAAIAWTIVAIPIYFGSILVFGLIYPFIGRAIENYIEKE